MSKARSAILAGTVLVAGLGLGACSEKRWCEQDATDTKVANKYCEDGTPGYEWEPDSDKKKKKKKKKSSH
ncbi:hypothetical protein ACGFNU_04275 [Spirillospora sp. NPDC048911]|uniref:hypothetical protein n=1 Tax=Spirillospora sp. NPDC048911 TaxID=3364527 RepID=UPI0037133A22